MKFTYLKWIKIHLKKRERHVGENMGNMGAFSQNMGEIWEIWGRYEPCVKNNVQAEQIGDILIKKSM